jgi:hypothetical protein
MIYTKAHAKRAMDIVKKHRLVSDRISELRKKGFDVANVPIGSGGIGKLKKLKKEYRLQIGYAKGGGHENYAECVIFDPPTK